MTQRTRLLAILLASTKLLLGALALYVSLRLIALRFWFRYWKWRRAFSSQLARTGMPREHREALVSVYSAFLEKQRPRIPGLLSLLGLEARRGHPLATLKTEN